MDAYFRFELLFPLCVLFTSQQEVLSQHVKLPGVVSSVGGTLIIIVFVYPPARRLRRRRSHSSFRSDDFPVFCFFLRNETQLLRRVCPIKSHVFLAPTAVANQLAAQPISSCFDDLRWPRGQPPSLLSPPPLGLTLSIFFLFFFQWCLLATDLYLFIYVFILIDLVELWMWTCCRGYFWCSDSPSFHLFCSFFSPRRPTSCFGFDF